MHFWVLSLFPASFFSLFIHFVQVEKKLEYPLVRSSSALTFCPIQHKYQTAQGLLSHCVGKGEESPETNPEDGNIKRFCSVNNGK